ncbi:hypothetical protein KI387_016901, partial [Taxus chinensis]
VRGRLWVDGGQCAQGVGSRGRGFELGGADSAQGVRGQSWLGVPTQGVSTGFGCWALGAGFGLGGTGDKGLGGGRGPFGAAG